MPLCSCFILSSSILSISSFQFILLLAILSSVWFIPLGTLWPPFQLSSLQFMLLCAPFYLLSWQFIFFPSILSIFFALHSLDLHFFTIIFLLLWWHVNSLRSRSHIFFQCFFSQSNISRISIIVFIVIISVYSWYHFVWLFLGVKSLLLFRTNQTTVQVQRYRNSFLTRALEIPNSFVLLLQVS